MTLEDLAEICDVHPVSISRYERGVRGPSDDKLERIAEGLGVSVEQLEQKAEELNGKESVPANAGQPENSGKYVTTTEQISEWRDTVIGDDSLGQWTQMLLMALPTLLDRVSWVIAITQQQVADETVLSEEVVEEHWQKMLGSKYVERVGSNEWTLRLVLPRK